MDKTFLTYEIQEQKTQYTIGDIQRPGTLVGKSYAIYMGSPGKPGQDGADGQAATISVGTTTTGEPGTSASVENVGTSTNAILNFTIPQGQQGTPGQDGVGVPQGGTAGQYLVKKSATDYDTEWKTLPTDDFIGKGVTFTYNVYNNDTPRELIIHHEADSVMYGPSFTKICWGDGSPIEDVENPDSTYNISHIYENKGFYNVTCFNPNSRDMRALDISTSQSYTLLNKVSIGFGVREISLDTGMNAGVEIDWGDWNDENSRNGYPQYVNKLKSYGGTELTLPVSTLPNGSNFSSVQLQKLIVTKRCDQIAGASLVNTNCPNLKTIIFESTTPPTINTGGGFDVSNGLKIIVPWSADHSILSAYKSASGWSTYASQIVEADAPINTGLPEGGTAGQILAKVDGTDYNTKWINAPSGAETPNGLKDVGTKIVVFVPSYNLTVTLNGSYNGGESAYLEYVFDKVDWGDGNNPESAGPYTFSHTYASEGYYEITLWYDNDLSSYGPDAKYYVKITSASPFNSIKYVIPGLNCYYLYIPVYKGQIDWKYWNNNTFPRMLYNTALYPDSVTYHNGPTKSIEFPEGITTFGESCINSGYETIILPSSTKSIKNDFISSSSNSTSRLICKALTPPSLYANALRYLGANCTILVPWSPDHSILNAYKAASGWSTYASQIYDGDGTASMINLSQESF